MSSSLAALLLGLALQEDAPATTTQRWKIEFALSLVEKEGTWIFVVDGTTDLPPGVRLKARLFVLDEIVDASGVAREVDDEALVRRDDPRQSSFRVFEPKAGSFREEVCTFPRKPFSIRYRAKIAYDPQLQSAKITLKAGDFGFERKADLRAGGEADYERELKERFEEATRHLLTLDRLGRDLAARAARGPGWKDWIEAWRGRIAALEAENERRFDVWAFWLECQARMRVGALCELLRRAADAIEADETERRERLLAGFTRSLEEAALVLGVDLPIDDRKVSALLAAYERAIEPLRAWIRNPEGDSAPFRRRAFRDGLAALFGFPPLVEIRRQGYEKVNALASRFARVIEAVDAGASPDELRRALREHDAALLDFKAFAGLP